MAFLSNLRKDVRVLSGNKKDSSIQQDSESESPDTRRFKVMQKAPNGSAPPNLNLGNQNPSTKNLALSRSMGHNQGMAAILSTIRSQQGLNL